MARAPEPTAPSRSNPHRLGVQLVDGGVDVSIVAGHASELEFCAIDVARDGSLTERRYALNGPKMGVWHAFIPGIRAGQRYGFRARGRWDPDAGLLYNPAKLLLDPYAKGIAGEVTLRPEIYTHVVDDNLEPVGHRLEPDPRDSAPFVAHSVVVDTSYNGTLDHLDTPWDRTVLYEAHVKGLTKLLPGVPEHLRGTYAGLAHPATIKHLKDLGVTAIELLPIHAKMPEPFLLKQDLTNYWGYNTLGFFAPEPSYATEDAQRQGPEAVLREVKGMVQLLHEAEIEVILDVVYNHTCEGGMTGPTLSWRGLDSTAYYMHTVTRPVSMVDVTACGNSLDFRRRRVIQMTLDSLRYWADDVGVDGFRFDLAVTLGRQGEEFNSHHPFFVAMSTDPILGSRKLINEPWDIGPSGWRTGQFPGPTADWNDKYRNAIRSFWLGDHAQMSNGWRGGDLRELGTRLTGSADMFSHGRLPGGRGMHASINFVTAHDGFTLRDLTTYNEKHNFANGEDNRDGSNDNRSWNHGVEGETDDAAINARRRQSIRNVLGTLILSAGTPMLTAGDEFGRTQHGNNNPYSQDNEISWVDWDLEPWQDDLLSTTSYLLQLRRDHRVLRPTDFYTGTPAEGDTVPDAAWYDRHGDEMPVWRWFDANNRVVQLLRSGNGGDADALIVINGGLEDLEVTLPQGRGTPFDLVWDSSWPTPSGEGAPECSALPTDIVKPGDTVTVCGQSIRVYVANPA